MGTVIPPFEIRPLAPDDQEPARALILGGLAEYWDTVDDTLNPDLRNLAESFRDGGFWVAQQAQRIIGTGGWRWCGARAAEISRMSVAPPYRRAGVGRALLRQLVRDACGRGATRLCLETNAEWQRARAFYEACGFQQRRRELSPFGPILWFERTCSGAGVPSDELSRTCQSSKKMS